VLQVARQLSTRGFETLVVMPRGDPRFAARLTSARIPYTELNLVRLRDTWNPVLHVKLLTRFWPNVWALRKLIRDHGIQVVHANGLTNLQAPIAARMEGVRLVWHLNDVSTPRLLRSVFRPALERWPNGIVVAAKGVTQHYFAAESALHQRCDVLYAPVDPQKFNPEVDGTSIRKEFGFSLDCPIIGTVCNLNPRKGVDFFVEAAPSIKERFPATKFLVVGEKLKNRRAYWSALMSRTRELGLEKDLVFTERRDDIPQLMRAMTVYVHPSLEEACPVSVLEASASGVPVVATDVGGTRELVAEEVTGLLVPPRSSTKIANAVVRLLESPDVAAKMGNRGRQRICSRFSLDACVENHIQVYDKALRSATT